MFIGRICHNVLVFRRVNKFGLHDKKGKITCDSFRGVEAQKPVANLAPRQYLASTEVIK